MSSYKTLKNVANMSVPQTEQADPRQVKNNAGGYTFTLSPIQQLRRFLILGTEGGTYYASEKNHTKMNVDMVRSVIDLHPIDALNEIVGISKAGRAPKNDPALFALSVAMAHKDDLVRKMAFDALPEVARTGTHILHLASFVKDQRSFGRGVQNAFESWMRKQGPKGLALQMSKYKSRDGMSMRDLLRLVRPKAKSDAEGSIYKWVVSNGWSDDQLLEMTKFLQDTEDNLEHLIYLQGVEEVARAKDVKGVVALINKYGLQREVIPTEFLNSPEVWEALLPNLGLEAMIRNLGNLSKCGLLTNMSATSKSVISRLDDAAGLKKSRIHPIKVLSAYLTYKSGKSVRGNGNWTPVQGVVDSLDSAFYKTFGNVTPTGKNIMLALDISGSMGWGEIAGSPGLTPRLASVAMALVNLNVESNVEIMGFSSTFIPLNIGKRDSIESAIKKIEGLPFNSTDCSLPMVYAKSKNMDIDMFAVYTDNETYAGRVHPHVELQNYRKSANKPNAALAVIGMTATPFTIANPTDARMLDVVGFDTATPEILSQFALGNI